MSIPHDTVHALYSTTKHKHSYLRFLVVEIFYPIGFSKIIFKPTVTVSLNIQKKNSRTIQLLAATRREGYFLIILCHYSVRQLKQVNNLK